MQDEAVKVLNQHSLWIIKITKKSLWFKINLVAMSCKQWNFCEGLGLTFLLNDQDVATFLDQKLKELHKHTIHANYHIAEELTVTVCYSIL